MKIAVLDDYLNVASGLADWTGLNQAEVIFFTDPLPPEQDVRAQVLQDFDVVVAMRERTPFPAGLLERLPRLKLLVTTGLRNNAIDMQAARRQGITVSGAPGDPLSANATGELAWALILGLTKRIPQEAAGMRAGGWQSAMPEGLAGKRLGVVGLGKLGQHVARVGLAFGMQVQAWSPNLTDERARQAGVQRVGKQELFAASDIVSLHLVLSASTAGVVDAAALRAMRPSAYLINTARAGLVDNAALLQALQARAIAGAGLDVFEQEPLPESDALRQLDNVILTPHLGYVSQPNFQAFYGHAVEAIASWMGGVPLRVLN
ncbi:D-2-hydroxyacid dehydrogenase family protein [Orrella sp. JC864]|uniref:D-2-hydroxyacid dehydrogenase family protein n=1 Tax=Orrella sp. JC864 TaxID=3120298 RepID=UPI00300A1B67